MTLLACNKNKYTAEDIKRLHKLSGLLLNQVARSFYVTYHRAWQYSKGINCGDRKLLELGRYYEKTIIEKGKREIKKTAGKRQERQ